MGHPGLDAVFLDQLNRAMEMRTGFHVNREIIRSSFGELGDKGIGVCDHEVDVERHLGDFSERRHNRWTDGQIRHEMPVHNIDMKEIGPRAFHGCNFVG